MLDNEPTGALPSGTPSAGASTDAPSTSPAPPARRRRTAGAEPTEPGSGTTAAPQVETGTARRSRSRAGGGEGEPEPSKGEPSTPGRRRRVTAAAGPPVTSPATAQSAADAGAAAAPAGTRRGARAAVPDPGADATAAAGEASGTPATTRRRRRAADPAVAPTTADTPSDAGADAVSGGSAAGATAGAVPSGTAADTTESTGRRRRRAAKAADTVAAGADADAVVPAGDETAPPTRRRRSRTAPTDADAAGPGAGRNGHAPPAGSGSPDSAPEPGPVAADDGPAGQPAGPSAAPVAPLSAAVMFVAPVASPPAPVAAPAPAPSDDQAGRDAEPAGRRRRRSRTADEAPAEPTAAPEPVADGGTGPEDGDEDETDEAGERRRRRRGRRGRGRSRAEDDGEPDGEESAANGSAAEPAAGTADADEDEDDESAAASRRRRRRRRRGGDGDDGRPDDPPNTVVHVREARSKGRAAAAAADEVQGVRGSTRLEAKRQRRRDVRDSGRRRPPILSEAEFLARREAVDRVMVVRQRADRTQIAVLEDDVLVEHYVTKASSTSYAGNVYLGRVQNVLPSMEAAFIDIGKGRNAVLYAGEVDWDVAGLEGKARSIEHALKAGATVVAQVTKDPIGHKGARLTSQVSLPGRYLVYVPTGSMTGISRKLPDTERARLKDILRRIVPEDAGVIIRTAAEGASEEELTRDVKRLQAQWEIIQEKAAKPSSAPSLLYGEPDLAIRVVRDVFNEDFSRLVVSGDEAWDTIDQYVGHVAPDLAPRLTRHTTESDVFADLRIDEQLMKALDRKVWLPSGGSLVIDRTEAMTVIDVNTGKFTGQGGTLEQTVTRNNLEAAEEIVRQLRLRDIGGIVVIDFIDMVLESNRDLVLRRLTECLGRDRTKHQVAEVTSLGLVQMTRKRVGQGLLEAFSEPCPTCGGRGLLVHAEPVEDSRRKDGNGTPAQPAATGGRSGRRSRRGGGGEPGEAAPPDAAQGEVPGVATADLATPARPGPVADASRAAGNEPPETDVPAAEVDAAASAAGGSAAGTGAAGEIEPAGTAANGIAAAVDAEADAGATAGLAGSNAAQPVEPAADVVTGGGGAGETGPRRRRRAASRPAGPPIPAAG